MRWNVRRSTRKFDFGSTWASNLAQTDSGFFLSSSESVQLLNICTPSSPVINNMYDTCFSAGISFTSKKSWAFCLKSLYVAVLSEFDQSIHGGLISIFKWSMSELTGSDNVDQAAMSNVIPGNSHICHMARSSAHSSCSISTTIHSYKMPLSFHHFGTVLTVQIGGGSQYGGTRQARCMQLLPSQFLQLLRRFLWSKHARYMHNGVEALTPTLFRIALTSLLSNKRCSSRLRHTSACGIRPFWIPWIHADLVTLTLALAVLPLHQQCKRCTTTAATMWSSCERCEGGQHL